MHPRLAELMAYLDAQFERLENVAAAIPVQLRTAPPGPERWSPANVLEHLVLVERSMARLFDKLLDQPASPIPHERDESPILPGIDLARMLDRTRRVVSRGASVPTGSMDFETALVELREARQALKRAALRGDRLALGEVTQAHPTLGVMTMYAWIAFAGAHMARHTAQIEEGALSSWE